MTHTICSVGFLLYLCEMETKEQLFVDYHMFGDFDINIFGESDIQIYDDLYTERLRHKMGGDKGIHLVVSPEQDPLIQGGVNL